MKKILVLFFILFPLTARADVLINSDKFPDEEFRAYVNSSFDINGDGILSDSEISSAKKIYVENKNIASLKGIEYFTALTELSCGHNTDLTTLDLSKNVNLEVLFCTECSLKEINVSGCLKLKEFYCYLNQIENLDITNNTELVSFDCQENKISTLDVSKNKKLKVLDCGNNNLSFLDVANNTELQWLYCRDLSLNCLDISKLSNLTRLWCWNCGLDELDISGNKNLRSLRAYENNLIALDLENKNFTELSIAGNNLPSYELESNLGLNIIETDGKFQVNFDDISELYRVSNVLADIEIDSYNAEQGIAEFSSRPSKIFYEYNTGLDNVTLNVTLSNLTTTHSYSSGSGCNSGFYSAVFLLFTAMLLKTFHRENKFLLLLMQVRKEYSQLLKLYRPVHSEEIP